MVATDPYRGIQEMTRTLASTWYEKGREQGRRELLREQLEERFGPLTQTVRERLEQLPAEHLALLVKAVLSARSLKELGLED